MASPLGQRQFEIRFPAKFAEGRSDLAPIGGVFPDYAALIVRNAEDGQRELSTARWGMPSPQFALKGRNSTAEVNRRQHAFVTIPPLAPWAPA